MKEKALTYRVITFWILVLAGLLWFLLLYKTPDFKLGLDLNGGTSLTYVADISKINEANKEAKNINPLDTSLSEEVSTSSIDAVKLDIADSMNGLREVIEKRINIFGVSEPIIRTEYSTYTNEYRLVVELPGISDIDEAISLIGDTPILEFKIVEEIGDLEGFEDLLDTEDLESNIILTDTGLNGNYLKKSVVTFDQYTGRPVVVLSFNEQGKQLFADITKNNLGKQVAIFLDGEIISSPVIQDEISGGEATITGDFTTQEAKILVQRLNSGALPVPITLASSQVVEASLGSQAKTDGLMAGIVALSIIILFMIIWYRLPGLLASLALIIYTGIVLMLFKLIPVVLTAAGIAGFIISVGIAIDANILIFERLKEEIRKGKNLRDATEEAFKRAWTSIRDSNIASILVAIILFYFGSALLSGFGLVFGLGVFVSMFSAMIITKYFMRAIIPVNTGGKSYKLLKFLMGSGFSKLK